MHDMRRGGVHESNCHMEWVASVCVCDGRPNKAHTNVGSAMGSNATGWADTPPSPRVDMPPNPRALPFKQPFEGTSFALVASLEVVSGGTLVIHPWRLGGGKK